MGYQSFFISTYEVRAYVHAHYARTGVPCEPDNKRQKHHQQARPDRYIKERDGFQANSSLESSASGGACLPPLVRRPRSPFLASRSTYCSVRALCLPACRLRRSDRTWLGLTNSLFS